MEPQTTQAARTFGAPIEATGLVVVRDRVEAEFEACSPSACVSVMETLEADDDESDIAVWAGDELLGIRVAGEVYARSQLLELVQLREEARANGRPVR